MGSQGWRVEYLPVGFKLLGFASVRVLLLLLAELLAGFLRLLLRLQNEHAGGNHFRLRD